MKNPGVTLNSAFLRPRSRDTVRIAGSDPKAAPLIDPNYWADPMTANAPSRASLLGRPYDRECSIKGLRLAREILRQPALKPFVVAERMPGDDLNTDEELVEYAYYHARPITTRRELALWAQDRTRSSHQISGCVDSSVYGSSTLL
jgi:choline dehydrogenase